MADATSSVFANAKIMNDWVGIFERQRSIVTALDQTPVSQLVKRLNELQAFQRAASKTDMSKILAQTNALAILANPRYADTAQRIMTAPKMKALSTSISQVIEGIAVTRATPLQLDELRDAVGQLTRRYEHDLVDVATDVITAPNEVVPAEDAVDETTDDPIQPTNLQIWLIAQAWALGMVWSFAFDQWLQRQSAEVRAKYGKDAADIRNRVVATLLSDIIRATPVALWLLLKKK